MSPSNASVNLSYPAFTGSTVKALIVSKTFSYKGFLGGAILIDLSATSKPSSFIMSSIKFVGGITGLGAANVILEFSLVLGGAKVNSAII